MNARLSALLLLALSWGSPVKLARAQTDYAGLWNAGPSRIAVTIHSWGNDCGPQPQSTTQPGGGTVEITSFGGHNLAIHSTDRTILSNACWSQNRAVQRVSSSFLDGVWTTKCRTSPGDPKSEEGEYVIKAQNNGTLQYRDSSNYNWELRTSRCAATIVTTQTLTRSTGAAPTKAAATKQAPTQEVEAEEPEPTEDCTPGPAARIVMRPKRSQIEPGQRTCVRAIALDAAGCPVPGSVTWSLQHSPALRGSVNGGCFEAASSAAEAEGEFKLVAQANGLRGEAFVNVVTVDFSDLMAKRIETGAVTGETAIPEAAAARSQSAARVQARAEAAEATPLPLLAMALGLLLALGGGLVWAMRRRSPPTAAAATTSPTADVPASVRTASVAAPPPSVSAVPAAAVPSGETWICPVCRRGAPREQVTCRCKPEGTALIPYAEFANATRAAAAHSHKSCPSCQQSCPAAAGFCGSCGHKF